MQTSLPQTRAEIVARPTLFCMLDKGVQGPLTVVSAPAGFGKTTLLSTWARTQQTAMAWLTLDEGDNDPVRFWNYVITALQIVYPECGKEALTLLRLSQAPDILASVDALVHELAHVEQDGILILDDYQLIETAHESITFLLDHMSPHLHVVIGCRVEPSLPLARWRAHGQLIELGANDLRLTLEETGLLMNDIMKLDLTADDLALLEQRTEGWAVGLHLFALSIARRTSGAERTSAIERVTGTQRFILDYLADEVLQHQTQVVQNFLLQTSLLNRLTASLCDEVLGRSDSQAMLEQLEKDNVFLVPLDDERRWYRYHHLFTDFLRNRLAQTHPQLVKGLHRRASVWYERHEWMNSAIRHALASSDNTRAVTLVEQGAVAIWMRGELRTLQRWLDALPETLVYARPRLCLYRAWILHYTGQATEVEHWLQETEKGLQVDLEHIDSATPPAQSMMGEVYTIRSLVAYTQSDVSATKKFARTALALLPEDSIWRSLILYTLGVAMFFSGDDTTAMHYFTNGILLSRSTNSLQSATYCYRVLAGLQYMHGQLHRALATLEEALEYILSSPLGTPGVASHLYVGMNELYYEWNDLPKAREYAEKCILYGKRSGNMQAVRDGDIGMIGVLLASNDVDTALTRVEKVQHLAEHTSRSRVLILTNVERVHLWMVQENKQLVEQWLTAFVPVIQDELDPLYVVEQRMLAQVYLYLGHTEQALTVVKPLLPLLTRLGRVAEELSILAIYALILHTQRDTTQALNIIASALAIGEAEGYIRTFVDYGKPMGLLLTKLYEAQQRGLYLQGQGCSPAYTLKLLHALSFEKLVSKKPQTTRIISTRETTVLRLLADGLSDKEIAKKLVIAEETARTHTKRIYAKLTVKNRTQAVARARELGLL